MRVGVGQGEFMDVNPENRRVDIVISELARDLVGKGKETGNSGFSTSVPRA